MGINTIEAFFALIRGGLWEQEVNLSSYGEVDFSEVYRLAEEQSVIGLVAAGLEHVTDVKLPKEEVLQLVGYTLQLEQQNKAMNLFIASLISRMRAADIYTILVKGQGVAQCYERPLWRASGDIDLLLSEDNYSRAKRYLIPLATSVEEENTQSLHLGMTMDSWVVELHGSLRSCSLSRMDKVIDDVQRSIFLDGNVRSWNNNSIQVFLPSFNNDVFLIFTHIIKHFFHEGVGLRQVCDWCRLLWTFRDTIDIDLLEKRIKKAGLLTEWRALATLAVVELGMPVEAMPLYEAKKLINKADRIKSFIIATGNFGQNRDFSYYHNPSLIKRKSISLLRHTSDTMERLMIFPLDTILVWNRMFFEGIKDVFKNR